MLAGVDNRRVSSSLLVHPSQSFIRRYTALETSKAYLNKLISGVGE